MVSFFRNEIEKNYRINTTDSLVVFRFDRLYTLFLGEDFFRLRPLNNEGLEGAEITSIASFGDTVYVTTLSGVYQRGIDVFYEDF